MDGQDPARLSREFFEAYGKGETETMRSLLAPDAVSFITRLPDLEGAELSTSITQVVAIDGERAMTMVEVKAVRQGRALHNFAAFLTRSAGGRITRLWMVDARPAYSDEFWS
jgi:ketosteroid isomerase-like protein